MNAKIVSLTRRVSTSAALAAAISCAFAFTATAVAEESGGEPLTRVVNYADLNLNSDAGVKVLYSRLRYAARHVCNSYEGQQLIQGERWRDCYSGAMERAVTDIDMPTVTIYHLAQTGQAESPAQLAKER